jgi:hypothetical protein
MRNPARFVTPSLLPWTEFADDVKEFDSEVVRDAPVVLARHGLGAVPSR